MNFAQIVVRRFLHVFSANFYNGSDSLTSQSSGNFTAQQWRPRGGASHCQGGAVAVLVAMLPASINAVHWQRVSTGGVSLMHCVHRLLPRINDDDDADDVLLRARAAQDIYWIFAMFLFVSIFAQNSN
ncbi:hypothetical protein ACLKA7_016474 [Drosophila subpalustris]